MQGLSCAFFGKSAEHIFFLVQKCVLIKKKDVNSFPWRFKVTVTSQSDVPNFYLI